MMLKKKSRAAAEEVERALDEAYKLGAPDHLPTHVDCQLCRPPSLYRLDLSAADREAKMTEHLLAEHGDRFK